jgi:hypothetical protein
MSNLSFCSVQSANPICVHYSTKTFKDDKWAIHYYAPIQGHELATRRDLVPAELDHPRNQRSFRRKKADSQNAKLITLGGPG